MNICACSTSSITNPFRGSLPQVRAPAATMRAEAILRMKDLRADLHGRQAASQAKAPPLTLKVQSKNCGAAMNANFDLINN